MKGFMVMTVVGRVYYFRNVAKISLVGFILVKKYAILETVGPALEVGKDHALVEKVVSI